MVFPGFGSLAQGALGGGVERYCDVLPGADHGVAHNECVHACLLRPEHHIVNFFQFPLFQSDVDGEEYPGAEGMRIGTQPFYVRKAVARILARPESRAAYIHCIGTAVYSRNADVRVPRGGEKFKISHYFLSASMTVLIWAASEALGESSRYLPRYSTASAFFERLLAAVPAILKALADSAYFADSRAVSKAF